MSEDIPAGAGMPPNPPRRSVRQTTRLLLWIAAGAAVGSLLLLGMPGALLLAAVEPVARLWSDALLSGDAFWPAAIVLSLICPFAVPGVYLGAVRLAPPGRGRVLVTSCFAAVACFAIALATVLGGG